MIAENFVGRRLPGVLVWLLLGGLLIAACGKATGSPVTLPKWACPGEGKLGVYKPHRLQILKECVWYVGIVAESDTRSDGDLHLAFRPDAGFERFLNAGNTDPKVAGLVVEIMPGQKLPSPAVGEHIAVFGTWVLDTHNDWNEIHPVWGVVYLDRRTSAYSLPPKTPLYTGTPDA